MGILSKLKTVFRGDIPIDHLRHEAWRRRKAAARQKAERNALDALNGTPARLLPEFAKYSSPQLLNHFQSRERPSFPFAASRSIAEANAIVEKSTWPLMGFGPMRFDGENAWRRDPVSGHDWGLDYHADLTFVRDDGSDVRVLWELNRLGHLLALGSAYQQTNDEKYAETFFSHIEAWNGQNPYARGANWGCAMEVALRVCNVLATFQAVRTSSSLTETRLEMLLAFFDHHGRFILDNNEFSYIATSNHYLSDVVGLFWIGALVPELGHGAEWRDLGLRELLREMDKQVLPDGADFESSSGYHRFVTEMFLHTFHLALQNAIEINEHYWKKLDAMLDYLRGITRPDGKMPLVGDCDGSRFLPFKNYDADHAQFLIDLADKIEKRSSKPHTSSTAFPNAAIYILRDEKLHLHFNASDCGLNGRGSHGHNDALSIEVFANGCPFIVDPGSYAYNLDLNARHLFRSTAYHSTVMVDGIEQNTIERDLPFIIGNEAKPRVLEWSTAPDSDRVSAEHCGYQRLANAVTHRRTIEFDKTFGLWTIDDVLTGKRRHQITFNFHLAPGLGVEISDASVNIHDDAGRYLILVVAGGIDGSPRVDDSFFAPHYGKKVPTKTLTYAVEAALPFAARFILVPALPDNLAERLELAARFTDNS